MSLRDRPGPGVQGFPFLFIATAESIYVQRTPPEPGQGPLWEPWCPSTISWKDWGKEAWEQAGGWVPRPPAPTPGTLLPRRTSNLCSLGDHSVNCRCHQEV